MNTPPLFRDSFSSSTSSASLVPSSSSSSSSSFTCSTTSTTSSSPIRKELTSDNSEGGKLLVPISKTHRLKRQESKMNLNAKDLSTRDEIKEIQKKKQDLTLEHRWIMAVPLGLLIDLEEIIKGIYKEFKDQKKDFKGQNKNFKDQDLINLFEIFQGKLNEQKKIKFDEARGCFTEVKEYRSKDGLDGAFKNYIENLPEVKEIKIILDTIKKINFKPDQSSIDSTKSLIEMRNKFKAQVQPNLEATEKEYQEILKSLTCKDEKKNEYFKEYKTYFSTHGYTETGRVISNSSIDTAKIVFTKYIELHPRIILDLEQFYEKTQLAFIETSKCSISDPNPSTIQEMFTVKEFKDFCKKKLKNIEELIAKCEEDASIKSIKIQDCVEEEMKFYVGLRKIDTYFSDQKEGKVDIFDRCKYHLFKDFQKDLLKLLENKSFKINSMHDPLDRTLLHFATDRDTLDFVKLLVNKGASSDIFNTIETKLIPYTFTPFHRAAANCNYEALSYFLSLSNGKTLINLFTKSASASFCYHALHFVITPQLMFKNLEKEYLEKWQNEAYACVELLCKNGANITGFYSKSIFMHSIDEYMSYCKESKLAADKMKQNHEEVEDLVSIQKSISTLDSIINFFLKKSNLPNNDLKGAVEYFAKASNRLEDEVINKNISEIFAEIFNHTNFDINDKRKVLTNLSFPSNSSKLIQAVINKHQKDNHILKRTLTSPSSNSSSIVPRSQSTGSSILKKSSPLTTPTATPVTSPRSSSTPTTTPISLPTPMTTPRSSSTPMTTPRSSSTPRKPSISRSSTSPISIGKEKVEQESENEQSPFLVKRIRFKSDGNSTNSQVS